MQNIFVQNILSFEKGRIAGWNISINEIIHYNKKIGKNVFVIDIYRSPIERKISEYFEKLSCHHFNNTDENINKYNITYCYYFFFRKI
jgi:hypothetical protein